MQGLNIVIINWIFFEYHFLECGKGGKNVSLILFRIGLKINMKRMHWLSRSAFLAGIICFQYQNIYFKYQGSLWQADNW